MRAFRDLSRIAVTSLLAAALAFGPAYAAIFASDLSVTGNGPYMLHYVLNEAAESGTITVAAAATPDTAVATIPLAGEPLAKGAHDVAFDAAALAAGSYVFRIHVAAAPHSNYDIITPLTDLPAGVQVGYGVKSNIHRNTLTFGHFYFADFGTSRGVHEFNAAGLPVQTFQAPETGQYVPVGLALDTNGDVYFSDQNIDRIYQFTPTGSPVSPTWTQAAEFSGPIVDAEKNYGSMLSRGFQVFGTGAQAKVYMAGYAPVPNPVLTTTLGDTTNAPTVLFEGSNISGTRVDQILVTPDEKTIYISSGAVGGRHLNKMVFGLNPATQVEEWYLDPGFNENIAENAVLTGRSRGLAFTEDRQYLWVSQNLTDSGPENNYIAKVALTPSPSSPLKAIQPLRLWGGLDEFTFESFDLDVNLDGVIDMVDILAAIRQPGAAGLVVDRIPAPLVGDPALPVLPVTLDADIKGNLIVAAHTSNSASGTVANAFYVVAPPDSGSSDTGTSAPFDVGVLSS